MVGRRSIRSQNERRRVVRAEITFNGNATAASRYVGWAPLPVQVRLSDPTDATGPVSVRLRNQSTTQGGQVVFFSAIPDTARDDLQLTLPLTGTPVQFFLAGRFQRPSIADRDANVQVVNTANNRPIGTTPLMVRVRKDANTLSIGERTRLLAAFATLNDRGMGRFADFRNIHTSAGDPEAHENAGFPPWHRAYLLDLERELQRIDSSVALPYWRFDQAAPNLFTRDFMGVPDPSTGRVLFSATNPLQFWATDGVTGIVRRPRFNTQTQRATSLQGPVITEPETFQLGLTATSPPVHRYRRFRRYEVNPHGTAHVSFTGSIAQIPTAAKDPLFFLLHANVDRLWAKWQWLKRRFDINATSSFEPLGAAGSPGTTRVGHNSKDTMWPWNQVTTPPRPSTAPGGTMAPSLLTAAPGLRPTVESMIDYQGVLTPTSRLGFDYDDVPFQFPPN
jgi:tyrosinase